MMVLKGRKHFRCSRGLSFLDPDDICEKGFRDNMEFFEKPYLSSSFFLFVDVILFCLILGLISSPLFFQVDFLKFESVLLVRL